MARGNYARARAAGLVMPDVLDNYCALHGITFTWQERTRKASPNVGYWVFKAFRAMVPAYKFSASGLRARKGEQRVYHQISFKDSYDAVRIVNLLKMWEQAGYDASAIR